LTGRGERADVATSVRRFHDGDFGQFFGFFRDGWTRAGSPAIFG
jgi:hypothetical protein